MRGSCTCGARDVEVLVVDGKFTAPGHACRRSDSGAARADRTATAVDEPIARPRRRSATTSTRSSPNGRAFAPFAVATPRTLRVWLPRAMRSREGPNGREWRLKARAAAEWRAVVVQALEDLGDARPHWKRARVHYDVYGRREIDRDNRIALGKPILDGLVAAGVLPDDRDDQVESVTSAWAPSPLPWGFVRVRVDRVSASAPRR